MNWATLIWATVFLAVGVLIGWSTRDWRDDDEKIEWLNLELGRMEERLDEAHATLERLRDVAAEHFVDDEPVYRPYVAGDDPRFRLDAGRDLTEFPYAPDAYEWSAAEEAASFLEDDTRHRRAEP